MTRKDITDLTIADDFMFGAVMRDPTLCKPLLEEILNIKIKRLEYPERPKVLDERYDSKGVRLDVYVEDNEKTVYNIEMQTTDKTNLPKRMRYYQGMIDLNILNKGTDYEELNKSFVIFICTFDLFEQNRYIYTFQNICREDTSILLNDDEIKVVVNVNGTVGKISKELKAVLDYIAKGIANTNYTKKLDVAVQKVKNDEEWRHEYMTLYMRDMENQKIGQKIGEKVGKKIGKKIGKRVGRLADKISLIRENKNEYDEETLSKFYRITKPECQRIISYINNYPDLNDDDIAEKLLNIKEDEE